MMIPLSSYTLKAASLGRRFIGLFPGSIRPGSDMFSTFTQSRMILYSARGNPLQL